MLQRKQTGHQSVGKGLFIREKPREMNVNLVNMLSKEIINYSF